MPVSMTPIFTPSPARSGPPRRAHSPAGSPRKAGVSRPRPLSPGPPPAGGPSTGRVAWRAAKGWDTVSAVTATTPAVRARPTASTGVSRAAKPDKALR